jgi:hypothetical protein
MKKLEVRLSHEPGQERIVGQLAETGPRAAGGQVVFEYDPAFLRRRQSRRRAAEGVGRGLRGFDPRR